MGAGPLPGTVTLAISPPLGRQRLAAPWALGIDPGKYASFVSQQTQPQME